MDIYKHMVKTIREIAPNVCLYFCMEDKEIWNTTMNISLNNENQLGNMLDVAAIKKCNLNIPNYYK